MKKILPIFLGLLFYSFLTLLSPASAAETGNQFGLNVAARVSHVDKDIGRYLQQDGWIVMMPAAPNYYPETADQVYNEIVGSYFSKLGSRVNYILRAHYPHASNPDFSDHPTFPDKDDPAWAGKWADFWAGIIDRLPIPPGSTFYFIPWNEPNLQRECSGVGNAYDSSDCGCVNYTLDYINQLETRLDRSKVKLLSPAFAVSAPNFYSFINCLGGGSFFNRFDGIALDYYDFETGCNEPFCNSDPRLNPDKYAELLINIGASGKKLFIVETGLVAPGACGPGVPDCPSFSQPEITTMLCELYNRHKNDSNLVMFSPLTYDPERAGGDWFWNTSGTKKFYLQRYEDCSLIEEEGEIIISDASNVCTDFVKEKGKSSQIVQYLPVVLPLPPDSTIKERVFDPSITGNVSLETIKFPKFERFQETMVAGLERTLPYGFSQEIILPGDTEMYFKHFAQGQDEGGTFDPSNTSECNQTPESKVTVPAKKWGKLVGAIRGLCTYLGFCPQVTKYQFQLEEPTSSCDIDPCLAGQNVADQVLPELENRSTNFSTSGWLNRTVKTSAEVIGNLLMKITTETKEKKEIKFLSRSSLSGGQETAENVEFLYNQLPLKIIKTIKPKDQAAALMVPFAYNVALSPDELGQYSGSYYELRKMRNAYCMRLCSLYPHGTSISTIDPICPSCNPKDYQFSPGVNDPELNMDLCQDSPEGCHYYQCKIGDPGCQSGCPPEKDPVCEGGKCNPYERGPSSDYIGAGCSVPYEGECTNSSLCVKAHFNPNPEGGYGSCRYTNETVCVRTDREAVGSCAAICNWQCCATN